MLQKINIEELTVGMFVSNVLEQKGLLKIKTQGLVSSTKSIEFLKAKGVTRLEIDWSRSNIEQPKTKQPQTTDEDVEPTSQPSDAANETAPSNVELVTETPPSNAVVEPLNAVQEKSVASAKPRRKALTDGEQIDAASKLYNEAINIQSRFFKRLEAKDSPSLSTVKDLSQNIIDSVLEMPNGLSCLTSLNKTGRYLLEHSLNCSIFLTMFSQYRNMPENEIQALSMAGLLMDVGMTNMPKDITQSTSTLTPSQKEILTTHVDIGLDLIERCGNVPEIVQDIIYNHHERVDGSGYPDALHSSDISVHAKMAGIVDSYTAMTNDRSYRKAIPPSRALSRLLRDPSYDQILVAEFIRCVGVHPVGSLIKLTNDTLAIVIRGNKKASLQPTVASFYNVKSNSYVEVKKIDLNKSKIQIVCSVQPEEFGINLAKFFNEVLASAI
jgi:HD-GYP domain-containing protein (c-di-GMP phosphodiesterase class II)